MVIYIIGCIIALLCYILLYAWHFYDRRNSETVRVDTIFTILACLSCILSWITVLCGFCVIMIVICIEVITQHPGIELKNPFYEE